MKLEKNLNILWLVISLMIIGIVVYIFLSEYYLYEALSAEVGELIK